MEGHQVALALDVAEDSEAAVGSGLGGRLHALDEVGGAREVHRDAVAEHDVHGLLGADVEDLVGSDLLRVDRQATVGRAAGHDSLDIAEPRGGNVGADVAAAVCLGDDGGDAEEEHAIAAAEFDDEAVTVGCRGAALLSRGEALVAVSQDKLAAPLDPLLDHGLDVRAAGVRVHVAAPVQRGVALGDALAAVLVHLVVHFAPLGHEVPGLVITGVVGTP
mmetsp:Transcript_120575/g.346416  ORF Transcript_120575/g.346416 Transcript_120575/m.346416 type:complete len:219 (-) Transcript_120575:1681-2337(-)